MSVTTVVARTVVVERGRLRQEHAADITELVAEDGGIDEVTDPDETTVTLEVVELVLVRLVEKKLEELGTVVSFLEVGALLVGLPVGILGWELAIEIVVVEVP